MASPEELAAYRAKLVQILRDSDKLDAEGIRRAQTLIQSVEDALYDQLAAVRRQVSRAGVPPWGTYWVPNLLRNLSTTCQVLAAEWAVDIRSVLKRSFDLGSQVADAAHLLKPAFNIILGGIDPALVKVSANFSADLVQKVTQDQIAAISQTVTASVIQGQSLHKLMDKLEVLVDAGPWRSARRRAETIARTESQRVFSLATQSRMGQMAAHYPDMGLMQQFLAAHVRQWPCPQCRKFDGKVWKLDGTPYEHDLDRPDVPVHPGCRCCWIPYFADMPLPPPVNSKSAAVFILGQEIPTRQEIQAIAEAHDYASVQVIMPAGISNQILEWTKANVADVDMVKLEDNPHVTVRYGFTEIDPDRLQYLVAGMGAQEMILSRPGLFYLEDTDVLRLGVHSWDLHRLNEVLTVFPHVDTHPVYVPHLTLGYIEKGSGYRYANRPTSFSGELIRFDTIQLSTQNDELFDISLG